MTGERPISDKDCMGAIVKRKCPHLADNMLDYKIMLDMLSVNFG